jgi:DNA-binding XRE family transcriptional regulator
MPDIDLANLQPISPLPEPAERVRLRKQFGVTQVMLAAELGVSRKTIIRTEQGFTEPTCEFRNKYAAILAAWAETERTS